MKLPWSGLQALAEVISTQKYHYCCRTCGVLTSSPSFLTNDYFLFVSVCRVALGTSQLQRARLLMQLSSAPVMNRESLWCTLTYGYSTTKHLNTFRVFFKFCLRYSIKARNPFLTQNIPGPMVKSGSCRCAKDLMPLQGFKSVICDINTRNSLLTADAFVDNLL